MKLRNMARAKSPHVVTFLIFCILLLATILRFVNYSNRWGLASDQARDAIMGRFTLVEHVIPEVGPFSQAGSVVMGPIWYWFVAIVTAIYPWATITPWVVITFSFVGVVYCMILIGRQLDDDVVLSLLLGLFTAVSPSEILQSTNLTNPSGVAIFATLALYFGIRFVKTGKTIYLFLFPLFVSLAGHTHLQAVGLLSLLIVIPFFKRPNLRQLPWGIFGFALPFVSLLPFELKSHFYDTRNLIRYLLYDQYTMYFPNRWLTYVGDFWPQAWAKIIGGLPVIAYGTMALVGGTILYAVIKRRLSKPLWMTLLSFLLILIELRYFRGEKFDGYLIFTHPFILTLTGWTVFQLYKLHHVVGFICIGILVGGSMWITIPEIQRATNDTQAQVREWQRAMQQKFPGEKFALYNYKYRDTGKNIPLVLFSYADNMLSDNGRKIGFAITNENSSYVIHHQTVWGERGGYQLLDLNSSTSAELSAEGWAFINPSALYKAGQKWYMNQK